MPAASVQKLLRRAHSSSSSNNRARVEERLDVVDRRSLQDAYEAILAPLYLPLLARSDGRASSGDTTPTTTTTRTILERIGTMGRLVQLLLEYQEEAETDELKDGNTNTTAQSSTRNDKNPTHTNSHQTSPTTTTTITTPSITGDARIRSMVVTILQAMSAHAVSAATAANASTHTVITTDITTNNNNDWFHSTPIFKLLDECDAVVAVDNDSPAKNPNPTRTVAAQVVQAYTVGTLLRLDHYCASRPFLLATLWKSLCDMVAAGAAANRPLDLPLSLVQQAVTGLTKHLQEGLDSLFTSLATTEAAAPDNDQPPFILGAAAARHNNQLTAHSDMVVKILGFLVVRLTPFLGLLRPAPHQSIVSTTTMLEEEEEEANAIVPILVQLWGISYVHGTNSSLQALAIKVEKCLAAWSGASILSNSAAAVVEHPPRAARVVSLVAQSKLSVTIGNDDSKEMVTAIRGASYRMGKATLLANSLDETIRNNNNNRDDLSFIESLLFIVEELLLRSLPALMIPCRAYVSSSSSSSSSSLKSASVLNKCTQSVSDALLYIETNCSTSGTDNSKTQQSRLHHLFVHWLSYNHTLVRELVLTILENHASACVTKQSASHTAGALPFLTLLVGLLFDPRTVTVLRTNIASLLSRILMDKTILNEQLESILSTEAGNFLLCLERSTTSTGRSKSTRKRRRPDINAHNGNCTFRAADMSIVLTVLSKLHQCNIQTPPPGLHLKTSKARIQRAAVHAMMSRDFSTVEMVDMLKNFLTLWSSDSSTDATFLAAAVLQKTQKAARSETLKHGKLSHQDLETMLKVVDVLCVHINVLGKAPDRIESEKLYAIFEAIRVLGALGGILNASTPEPVLDHLVNCFRTTLSCEFWAIRAMALTSLVEFATSVPSQHKDVLRRCLPKKMHSLLQGRLQSCQVPGNASSTTTTTDSIRRHAQDCYSNLVAQLPSQLDSFSRGGSMLPIPSSVVTLANGSFVMQMPTQEGRSAVVVFPPGKESLEDILFMLGCDPNDLCSNSASNTGGTNDATALHNVRTLGVEGGCQLYLRQFSLSNPSV